MTVAANDRYRRNFLLAVGGMLAAPLAWNLLLAKQDASAPEAPNADLPVSPAHLACIRKLRFVWVPNVESGGPSVDMDAPFGSPDAYGDLARLVPATDRAGIKHIYAEVMNRLPVFARTAKLQPGLYSLPEAAVRRLKEFTNGGDTGIGVDGRFSFTQEHGKLIAAMKWRYAEPGRFGFFFNLSLDPRDWAGPWEVATVNFKRPFGDMTYFELDMAAVLGTHMETNAPDPEADRLFALYRQMHVAFQVFVLYAAL
jgi:hypothetical protein